MLCHDGPFTRCMRREVFSHTEELRLTGSDTTEEGDPAQEETKSSSLRGDKPKYQGRRSNVVVVLGMPGSGVLSVAAQVHARVGAEYEEDSLRVLVLDINDANVEDNIRALSQMARAAGRPAVIAVIDSALKHIPITAVFTRFSENGCDICCCISVLSLPGEADIWQRSGRYYIQDALHDDNYSIFLVQDTIFRSGNVVSDCQKCTSTWSRL